AARLWRICWPWMAYRNRWRSRYTIISTSALESPRPSPIRQTRWIGMSGSELSSYSPAPESGAPRAGQGHAFNIPNMLTYARILAVPLIVLCFFLEGRLRSSDFARWSALGLFLAASITDYLDGYLARIWKQTSNIGRMLDPI